MTEFYRLSAGGNDFLALVEPESIPSPQLISAWCSRGRSAGADGVFVITRPPASDPPTIAMTYFNADGGAADLCLNATRCAARLAAELGWTAGPIEITTGAGPVWAAPDGQDQIKLELPLPGDPPRTIVIEGEAGRFEGQTMVVGVPHLVIFQDDSLAELPVVEQGRALRYHRCFAPHGTNVDFVRVPRSDLLEIRTYERGVEAETLACGTGILAAAFCGWHRQLLVLPIEVRTLGNLPLRVEGVASGRTLESWSLIGDARVIARGRLLPGASVSSAPPSWS